MVMYCCSFIEHCRAHDGTLRPARQPQDDRRRPQKAEVIPRFAGHRLVDEHRRLVALTSRPSLIPPMYIQNSASRNPAPNSPKNATSDKPASPSEYCGWPVDALGRRLITPGSSTTPQIGVPIRPDSAHTGWTTRTLAEIALRKALDHVIQAPGRLVQPVFFPAEAAPSRSTCPQRWFPWTACSVVSIRRRKLNDNERGWETRWRSHRHHANNRRMINGPSPTPE